MADITIVNGVYKPTYNWGAPSCTIDGNPHVHGENMSTSFYLGPGAARAVLSNLVRSISKLKHGRSGVWHSLDFVALR